MDEFKELQLYVGRIFDAVVKQGKGLFALEGLVGRIRDTLNNKIAPNVAAVPHLEARIARLEAILGAQQPGQPQLTSGRPQMKTVNPMPSNVRQLSSAFAQSDDDSADADFEYDDDEEDVG